MAEDELTLLWSEEIDVPTDESTSEIQDREGDSSVADDTRKKRVDDSFTGKIPKLPPGIDRYFFVSHSNEDSEKVFRYVQALENRFNLSCVYADRDFQPGKDISENIKEGMARSFKVLLFLSPNFQQSGWCKYERDFAFVNSIENGSSCVIPIKLEDCQIPVTFKTLTYIDATKNGVDVPERIASALAATYEADGYLPLDYTSSLQKYQNGYSFIISARREYTICPISPAKYKFHADQRLHRSLKNNKVELPEDLLKECIEVVNNDWVMASFDYMKRCNIFCWCIIALPLYGLFAVFFYTARDISYASREPATDSYDLENTKSMDAMLFIAILPSLIGVAFITFILFLPMCCNRKTRELRLQQKLWIRFCDRFISGNALVIYFGRKKKLPKLHLMRYNFTKCKEYLADLLQDHFPQSTRKEAEEKATQYIKSYVLVNLSAMADDFDGIPEAPINRHNVKKGKMCICQVLQNTLFEHS